MLISLKWLEEILGTKIKTENLNGVFLNLGLEIEEMLNCAPEGISIGRINNISTHPRAKHLSILEIKANKKARIVTAAKNVKEDDLVLVAPVGITLNGQKVLEKNFNGITSEGVLVSEQELGLAETSSGVIVLQKGRVGKAFKDVFDDIVLDMSATPNRPDWLSVVGIARELAVGLGIDNYRKEKHYKTRRLSKHGIFQIKIQDMQGCPRYTARIFENVVVKESPFWIKWRLHCMGMKHVNNVVDSTNMVMLLTGQSLHPFDLDILKRGILVRKAHNGEEFVTLEGTILKLESNDLVIADRECIIALAGVIGARRGQISNSTTRVLLESAYFDPKRIAHTSRRLNIMTEASTRFERGGDMWAVDKVSAMCGEFFTKLAHAREVGFIARGKKMKVKTVQFSLPRLNNILSLNLTEKQIKVLLKKIGISVRGRKNFVATIPHFRRDVQIEQDVYEEVARVYGYMNIPEILPRRWAGKITTDKNFAYEEALKHYLVGQGFCETYNISLLASKRLADSGLKKFATIKNPLNERFDALRPTLFFGLLDALNFNLSKGNRSLKLFEIGNILFSVAPFQDRKVGIIMGGKRYPDFWDQKGEQIDYFDTKGIIEGIFGFFRIKDIAFRPAQKFGCSQAVSVRYSGKELGYLGVVDERFCKEPFFYSEIALEPLWSFMSEPFYLPPAKFPSSTRDLSFLVGEDIEIPDVINLIVKVSGPVLEKVNLFDYYKGNNLPRGKKNLGFRLYFRAPDRTLTDKEVDIFVKKIAGDVIKRFKADLRTKEKNWTN